MPDTSSDRSPSGGPHAPDYDCVVIGAGPAGSTTAALVAEQGWRTLLVERDEMPRFHVGESLMPETYWTLQRLGVLEQMKSSCFVRKHGVQFVTQRGRETKPFLFPQHDPRECSQTWHVERSDFDQMLYENAARLGAECRDETRVFDIKSEQQPCQLTLKSHRGESQVTAHVVVDATGLQALLASRLGLKEQYEDLRKAAIWGYYRGGQRRSGEEAELTTILHTSDKDSWFWYIPMSNDTVSVGLVSDSQRLTARRGTPEQLYAEEMAKCATVRDRLQHAERIGSLRVAKEFSYRTSQHAGDGWVLVGDAFGFIDPIYSSGVFLALKSGELAADAIAEGLAKNDVSAEQLSKWCPEFEKGVHLIFKLVRAFYTREFSFGAFVNAYPEHQRNLTDLLIGRVFQDGAGAIFRDMDPWIEQIDREARP